MSKRYYFASSKNEKEEERNKWLDKNRNLLKKALFWEWFSASKKYGHHDKYVQTILNIRSKVEDLRRNTFTIEELKEVIFVLGNAIDAKERSNDIPDNKLVDHMYSLVEEYIKIHEKEQGMRNSTHWIFEDGEIEDVPKEKPSKIKETITRFPRNHELAERAIRKADYKCEFDVTHAFFESANTHNNYVEAHHLIPLQFQDDFDMSLDVLANIVSLCVVCHKKLHHGLFEDKEEILRKLFELRRNRLKKCGLDISEEELFSYYISNLEEDI
jgi:predicted HNH restriction endonuclease